MRFLQVSSFKSTVFQRGFVHDARVSVSKVSARTCKIIMAAHLLVPCISDNLQSKIGPRLSFGKMVFKQLDRLIFQSHYEPITGGGHFVRTSNGNILYTRPRVLLLLFNGILEVLLSFSCKALTGEQKKIIGWCRELPLNSDSFVENHRPSHFLNRLVFNYRTGPTIPATAKKVKKDKRRSRVSHGVSLILK